MKKIFVAFALLVLTKAIMAQSFSIKLTPDTTTIIAGQNTSFSLTATPTGGFSASIFLSLQSFQISSVTITPSALNPPYNNCTVNVTSSSLPPGLYPLVIKGQQGSIISYDTGYVKVIFNPNLKWYQFTQQNSGILCNEPEGIAIDKNNSVYVTSGNVYPSAGNCNSANYGLSLYNHAYWKRWTNNQYTTTDFWGHQDTTNSFSLPSGDFGGVAIDTSNTIWVGSYTDGLIKIKNNTFTHLFPGETINKIATFNNKVCVGTSQGVRYYNGTAWQIFNTSNSYLPNNSVYSVAMENDTVLWMGTLGGGLAKYDMHFWTIYNSSNSIIPNDNIWTLAIDKLNNKWLASMGSGLIKYNNLTWQQFTPPCQEISALYPDYQNNIWLGFWSGNTNNCLIKFDGANWTQYNSSNSGFLSDATTPGYGRIHEITQDYNHVLWISTLGDGLFAFADSGLSSIFPAGLSSINYPEKNADNHKPLIYPNPANGNFTISSLEKIEAITVTNLLGETIIQTKPNTEFTQIYLSETGVYFMYLTIGNKTTMQKVIVTD
jgi:hypothetical protein